MPKLSRKLSSKVRSLAQLQKILLKKDFRSSKIVFTNGCFDILHRGHITYLEKARNLGDALIVALNSDSSVKKLKGPSRPLNSLTDRLEVIASLESVDWVTWFEDDTPLNLILKLRPNVIAKGGDWQLEQIVGAKEAPSWGGKVKSIPYVVGKSTTGLIEKVRKTNGF